jgi:hypothetical protein
VGVALVLLGVTLQRLDGLETEAMALLLIFLEVMLHMVEVVAVQLPAIVAFVLLDLVVEGQVVVELLEVPDQTVSAEVGVALKIM